MTAPDTTASAPALPRRPRLARSRERARWGEYRALLASAVEHGYALTSLEHWLLEADLEARRRPTLIVRHDVDQHPASALRAAREERPFGLRSTWYFRWRTAHPHVVETLRDEGHEVGLHYETLSRETRRAGRVIANGELIEGSRALLAEEVEAFAARFGPIRSICAHGDTSMPHVRNLDLLDRQDPARFGVAFDANFGMRARRLGCWLTDRSAMDGRWGRGMDPQRLLAEGTTPILLVMHPNNWAAGPALWGDRLLRSVPLRVAGRPIASGSDAPPL